MSASGCYGREKAITLPQRRIYLLQHPRPRTQLLLAELVERGFHGIEVGVEVFGVCIEVQQAGDDFAFRGVVGDVFERLHAVGRVVVGVGLARADDRSVVLRYFDGVAFVVFDVDGFARGPEVEAVDRFVVVAHVVVALGRAGVVVERDARADDVNKGGAFVRNRRFDEGDELLLVARETSRDEGRALDQGERNGVHRRVRVHLPALCLRTLVRGRRELALGQPVYAVVLEDVGHVHAAAHDVRELPQADRRRVAVAGDAEV